jgi:HSP20 family protein
MSSLITRSRLLPSATTSLFPTATSLLDDFWNRDILDLVDRNYLTLGTTLPSANVTETAKDVAIDLAAPGLKKDDFKIELTNNVLSVSSEQQDEVVEEDKEGNYRRKEFNFRSFYRSFQMPDTVDEKKIDATYKDGILHIVMAKKKIDSPKAVKTIEVK